MVVHCAIIVKVIVMVVTLLAMGIVTVAAIQVVQRLTELV